MMPNDTLDPCHLCPQQRAVYIYAVGVNPLDSSADFCEDHIDVGSKWVDVGDGVQIIRHI